MINPVIEKGYLLMTTIECCASLKGIWRLKKRFCFILLRYENLKREQKRKPFFFSTAQLLQHEIDHLNGKLIIDD
jgi:peptide deformylase